MRQMDGKEKRLYIRAVILLIFAMTAIAMLGEVARQNWNSKVTAYPTKTEEAVAEYAASILRKMTLEEKVGQMFFVTNTSDVELAAEYAVGGVLLSNQNLEQRSQTEVSAVVSDFQSGQAIPLFIGVNEEGGAVNTVSQFPKLRATPFLSPGELMTTGGMPLVESDTRDKCEFLKAMRINLNFAPVCDVTTDEGAFLYGRALGKDADHTARYVETVVRMMKEEQMVGVLKHFPGYGNLRQQLGTQILTDDRTLQELQNSDFLPFDRGIRAGAGMVLIGHVVVPAVDGGHPVSLSRRGHNILRQRLSFDGVIISDDLGAKGLDAYGTPEELVVQAVKAGSDMVLTADFERQIPAVLQGVCTGEISVERIDESVLRILKLKIQYGILS